MVSIWLWSMSESSEQQFVPGQGVLPGFEEVLRIESQRLDNPGQERFCWEYVTNGGKAGPAYQVAINPNSSLLNAQKRASELLKKPEITGRIKEIAAIIQRKYEHEVIASSLRALNFDPKVYLTDSGSARGVHELEEHARRGIGLEARVVDGKIMYLPVFPSPEKARDALQKMFGMEKVRSEVSGPGGGPIPHAHAVTDDMSKLDGLRKKFQEVTADGRQKAGTP